MNSLFPSLYILKNESKSNVDLREIKHFMKSTLMYKHFEQKYILCVLTAGTDSAGRLDNILGAAPLRRDSDTFPTPKAEFEPMAPAMNGTQCRVKMDSGEL